MHLLQSWEGRIGVLDNQAKEHVYGNSTANSSVKVDTYISNRQSQTQIGDIKEDFHDRNLIQE